MLNLAILILLVWTGNVCEHLHQVQNMQNVHETCICLAACKIPQVCQVGFAGCVRNVCWVAFQPFLLPWTCLVPLLTSWLLSHQQQRALQQFLILCPDGTSHMSCPVWCSRQCAILLQGSATTWNPRESPRVWAPPSLQNWPQPSPPSPPHCPIVQASPTSNWVLHTFSS